jgi:hypothetical protein
VSGNLVYGGEVAWSSGPNIDDNEFNPYVDSIGGILDLKGRVGTMIGSTLVYGSLGYSMGSFEESGQSGDMDGTAIGAGFETPFGDKGFFGGDFTKRSMSGTGDVNGTEGEFYIDDLDMTTVSIRLGFRF